jgi:cytochrome c
MKTAAAALAALMGMGCATGDAFAQFTVPAAAPDGATLFTRQCGTCHIAQARAETRQGPNLRGVIGRKAGSLPGFRYSGAFAASGIVWDEPMLDAYLTNPQAVVSGSVMVYRQANPETRARIIAWLKDQN